jgi:hypothetical protein
MRQNKQQEIIPMIQRDLMKILPFENLKMPGHASASHKILIVGDKVGLKHCPHISVSSENFQKALAHEYWLTPHKQTAKNGN